MHISIKKALLLAIFQVLITQNTIQSATKPKAVIIVFADTLVSNRTKMAGKIGWFNSLWNMSTALNMQKLMFDALFSKFGHQQGDVKAYDPQTHDELPVPFAQWLLGRDSKQVSHEIKTALSAYKFPKDSDREFIFGVLDIIFDPKAMAETFSTKSDMVKLTERIIQGPAHPRMIMVANCNDQLFAQLQSMYTGKEVLDNFNNIYLSSKTQLLVEDPALYRQIIQDHNLQPSEYVVITSNKHAIHAARAVGMQTVYSSDHLYKAGKDYCKSVNLIKK